MGPRRAVEVGYRIVFGRVAVDRSSNFMVEPKMELDGVMSGKEGSADVYNPLFDKRLCEVEDNLCTAVASFCCVSNAG